MKKMYLVNIFSSMGGAPALISINEKSGKYKIEKTATTVEKLAAEIKKDISYRNIPIEAFQEEEVIILSSVQFLPDRHANTDKSKVFAYTFSRTRKTYKDFIKAFV